MRKNNQDKSSQYGAVQTNETGRMIKKTYDGFQQAPAVYAWGQEGGRICCRSHICHAAKEPYENAGGDSRRRCPGKDGNGVVRGTGE